MDTQTSPSSTQQHPSPPQIPQCNTTTQIASLSRLAVHVLLHLFPNYAPHTNTTRLVASIQAILSRTLIKPTTVFLALKYLAGVSHAQPEFGLREVRVPRSASASPVSPTLPQLPMPRTHQQRITLTPLLILTAAIATADSFLNDIPHSMAHYAYYSGLSATRLAMMKKSICEALRWQLCIAGDVFEKWVVWLKGFAVWRMRRAVSASASAGSGALPSSSPKTHRRQLLELKIRRSMYAKILATSPAPASTPFPPTTTTTSSAFLALPPPPGNANPTHAITSFTPGLRAPCVVEA
ncbi:uncharacterized protein EV422DRAFT_507836 [Fimicolochytrium jonesii]|uniref:uncharacterized protein n=1 Tax=Fimicolochytrium jonesii TaxID=1396493 RepID=UPI0022FE729B|nr:uncharacterized protein EV422DRAFT_507836 [Fimicolochytrium jonesii]KAI8819034.1 hypothetical protein EV422DRAFT_507836 [Fimicolochytrium jonesii]